MLFPHISRLKPQHQKVNYSFLWSHHLFTDALARKGRVIITPTVILCHRETTVTPGCSFLNCLYKPSYIFSSVCTPSTKIQTNLQRCVYAYQQRVFPFRATAHNTYKKVQNTYVRLALCSSSTTEPVCLVTAQFHRLTAPSST